MGSKANTAGSRTRSSVSIFVVVGLCCFFYILGAWQKSGFGKGDSIALEITKQTDCSILSNLNFETHHNDDGGIVDPSEPKAEVFEPCDYKYTDYTPCQDQDRAMKFPREDMIYRERHCPTDNEKFHCLIPAPKGYITPFPWPKSRDYVHYANVPHKSLTVEKAVQNWVQFQGNVFKFPGGGTMFPHGADAYINELASVIPIADGTVRTALDTGCGVASWGAYLMKRNVLAMSFAPRDNHEAQVQFALERGVPAVIGVLGSVHLPYPARAFDMAQCSRCLIPWTSNNGKYLMEVDRVLRPGGFWILSGPPINWKTYYQTWKRTKEDLQNEQNTLEQLAESLCWEKKYEKGDIAIWRKKVNTESCPRKSVNFCQPTLLFHLFSLSLSETSQTCLPDELCVVIYSKTSLLFPSNLAFLSSSPSSSSFFLSLTQVSTNLPMGFPVGYTELFLPKLLLHTLSFLGFLRKLISSLFRTMGLGDFLESDISWPERPTHLPEFHSVSAVLLREILPVVRFDELEFEEGDTPDSCAVCLYEFEGNEEIRRLTNCRHIFHRNCLDRWMDHDQKTCPLCRTPFIPDDMQEAFNERLWAASGIPDFYSDYSSVGVSGGL